MKRRCARALLIAVVGILMLPLVALAQSQFTGVVKDESGGVLPGVTVEAASPVLIEKIKTATTDGDGRYRITDLRPGTYKLTFSLTGFSTLVKDGVGYIQAGAGIVADSVPEREYEECLSKAQAVIRAVERAHSS